MSEGEYAAAYAPTAACPRTVRAGDGGWPSGRRSGGRHTKEPKRPRGRYHRGLNAAPGGTHTDDNGADSGPCILLPSPPGVGADKRKVAPFVFQEAPIYRQLITERGDIPADVRGEAERIRRELQRVMPAMQKPAASVPGDE